MIGKLLSVLAAMALLAGAYVLIRHPSGAPSLLPGGEGSREGGGPKIILREVELVEERPEGQTYRLTSDNASFSIPLGRVEASHVRLWLRKQGGNVIATAPRASWNLDDGRIDLAEGADVGDGAGWNATARRASVDLNAEVIMAKEAFLAGPGLTVEGKNLRWRWRDSTVELDSPRSRVFPEEVPVPGRQG